jgi:hypothetical protein
MSDGYVDITYAEWLRLKTLVLSLRAYSTSGGKMLLTRTATSSNMRQWASGYTGVQYSRGMKGIRAALADLEAIVASAQSTQTVTVS